MKFYKPMASKSPKVPHLIGRISAGRPVDLDGHLERIDLHHLLSITETTVIMHVKGDSLEEADVLDGDMLVVERAIQPRLNDTVVAFVNSGFTVKKFRPNGDRLQLVPANKKYSPIECDVDCEILGVVNMVIRRKRF